MNLFIINISYTETKEKCVDKWKKRVGEANTNWNKDYSLYLNIVVWIKYNII